MKRWLMVMSTAVLCCGMVIATDEEAIGKDPNADYYVLPSQMVKIYCALAEDMADLTAQKRKVFLTLGDEVNTPTGPATQVTLMEETEHGVKTIKIFALDEGGYVYEVVWKEL